jgi:tRNA (guanosine-2'-O-)-methyltransferase
MLPFFLRILMNDPLITYLESFITERRKKLFDSIVEFRTRYITVVLEDIYQSHNASAVIRSCDCFGIQDVHIIENRNPYRVNTDIALGADKWISLNKYRQEEQTVSETIKLLRKKGYRIVVTTPHEPNTPLENFNIKKGKVALFFGTELKGITESIRKEADEYLKIPMYGFTESLNISVSAAIILHHLTSQLHTSAVDWKLTEQEKNEVKLNWLRKSIKNSAMIEKDFLSKNINNQNIRI